MRTLANCFCLVVPGARPASHTGVWDAGIGRRGDRETRGALRTARSPARVDTIGSWLSMQGVPLRVISEILGHSSTQVTEMYSHLSPEVMDRATEETSGGS